MALLLGYQKGKLTPYMPEGVLFIVQHMSGWMEFFPAHKGLRQYYSQDCRFPVKVRELMMKKFLGVMYESFHLSRGPCCLDAPKCGIQHVQSQLKCFEVNALKLA